MKKLFSLSTILLIAFVFIYSCSTEEEDTTPPPSVVATPEPEPAPSQYNLTVTAGEGGAVSTEGGTYDENRLYFSLGITRNWEKKQLNRSQTLNYHFKLTMRQIVLTRL